VKTGLALRNSLAVQGLSLEVTRVKSTLKAKLRGGRGLLMVLPSNGTEIVRTQGLWR
jgi:hypothetical protein